VLSHATSALTQSTRWRVLAQAEPLVLLVDLDGTLIDFAATPEEAVLDADAIGLLTSLTAAGVQVVVVSGRPRVFVEPLRAYVPDAWWVAEHGNWRWDPELSQQPTDGVPHLDELAARLEHFSLVPGVRFERKSASLCVHWRLVATEQRADLVAAIEIACDEWLEEHADLERIGGVELIEVRRRTVHKGTAVTWVRTRVEGARIIAIGDDTTDEDMFAELAPLDASVSVGPRGLQADAHARDVAEARAFLRWIADTRIGEERPFPIALVDTAHRKRHRLLVMSNRTPAVTQGRTREVGGLVSALEPALRDERGIWLGWSGQERLHDQRLVVDASDPLLRARFDLPPNVRQQFYAGFCNRVLWPLFHGFANRVTFSDGDWAAYVAANERYAKHATELAHRDAPVWIHDYHLLLAGKFLRALGHRGRLGLFLHIPFPAPTLLTHIPWGADLVDAMCEVDLLGFQTQGHATNFLSAARMSGRGKAVPEVGVFPATIDPAPYREPAADLADVAGLRAALGDRRLILGVDRLDYSKGIPERLEAYERLLERYPEWCRRVAFLQISVPTRAEISDYAELRERVEGLVGRINGRFGDTDWVPVRYLYRSYDQHVLAQLYRMADIALVTPLRDGMNLVAKEYVASQAPERPGVLVLSQFAGAAENLTGALITNPFHPEGLAADIDHALSMPLPERIHRYRMLAGAMEREGDARMWAQSFLDRLAPRRLHTVD
jgi:alpha,alpha-trehalose-phosphate synthase [UDP-forming]/trehalose-phosphatase